MIVRKKCLNVDMLKYNYFIKGKETKKKKKEKSEMTRNDYNRCGPKHCRSANDFFNNPQEKIKMKD